jgi:16S rRNA processing protein RimM
MPDPGRIKTGTISKPYGLLGQVTVFIDPEYANSIKTDYPLFIEIDGQRVPFFVQEVEWISDKQAILKLEFIDSVEQARNVSGCDIYPDLKDISGSKGSVHEFEEVVGYMAYDKALGQLGIIEDYLKLPRQSFWVIKHEKEDMMIPAVGEFVKRIEHSKNTIHFNLPEGIFNL